MEDIKEKLKEQVEKEAGLPVLGTKNEKFCRKRTFCKMVRGKQRC